MDDVRVCVFWFVLVCVGFAGIAVVCVLEN